MNKFSKKFNLRLQEIFTLNNKRELTLFLESKRSNIFGWRCFSDLSEKEITTELNFCGHIF
jgi:hypothetical protein